MTDSLYISAPDAAALGGGTSAGLASEATALGGVVPDAAALGGLRVFAGDCAPVGVVEEAVVCPEVYGQPGMEPVAAVPQVGGTALTAVMMGTIVLAAVNRRALGRALRGYSHQLWSVRRRPNAFDDEHTASPLMALLLALIFVVFGGVMLYFVPGAPPAPSFAGAAAAMGLLAVYYVFELLAYRTVAYAFATRESGRRWVDGFAATQAYAGLALILPALLAVYEPQWRSAMVIASLAIYFAARLLFIIKGFRIFYTNFASLLYFILYLCTLEVIPVLAVYRASVYLWAAIA